MPDRYRSAQLASALLTLAALAGCAAGPAVREMMGPPMSCQDAAGFSEQGQASWYGRFHQGRPTASGERFDVNKFTAAHRRLPLGSRVKVANLENGRAATFRINDRGPFVVDRILDVTQNGAKTLGFERDGTVPVKLEVVACGKWVKSPGDGAADTPRAASQSADTSAAPMTARETP